MRHREAIEYVYNGVIETIGTERGYKEDEKLIELLSILRESLWIEIHVNLSEEGEDERIRRQLINRYVIGGRDKSRRKWYGVLELLSDKVMRRWGNRGDHERIKGEYGRLYNEYMAIAACRSYKHFCKYMQSALGEGFNLWSETDNCFSGYWYYVDRMVLDGSVVFLEKQLPTGYGKSMGDCFQQAYTMGIDKGCDILKICGNRNFTSDCYKNVLTLMLSREYSEVFPFFSRYECNERAMFRTSTKEDTELSLRCSSRTSLRIRSKNVPVNGVRAKWLYLDDITQAEDMYSRTAHERDIMTFENSWFKRKYEGENFYIIAGGTSYSTFDILSHLKSEYGYSNSVLSGINKYTRIGKSNKSKQDGISVFVSVPLLDFDTDESTYPKNTTTEAAKIRRETQPEAFWAMDQQRPLPPKESPFYYTKLRQYESLPEVGKSGRSDCCKASIDTKRRGKDYLAMPIFFEAKDPDNGDGTVHYLVDFLYDNRSMKECIPLIISKIIQRNITRLVVENNTEECIAEILKKGLAERGYYSCVIDDVYSTTNKEKRIMEAEGDMRSQIIYPKYGLYSVSCDFGRAMMDLYSYNYSAKGMVHDDAPDSIALYSKHFISGGRGGGGKMFVINRN